MIKVKPIDLKERDELEPLLVANPDVIEQGLQIISHQLMTDSGPLDILAVDSEGTLIIIELKNEATEGHLDQALRYYDWCRQNISWISKAYSSNNDINPNSAPQLMLIAPSFTDTVKRISKYVSVELHLVQYQAFEDEKGERGILCNEIDYGQPPDPPVIPTWDEILKYFHDGKVKDLFTSVIEELQAKQIEKRLIQGLYLSFWYKGKRFMYMGAKRNFFVVEVLTLGGTWTRRARISNRNEWEVVFKEHIQTFIEYLNQQ